MKKMDLFAVLIMLLSAVSLQAVFFTDFEAYTLGLLGGQDGWTEPDFPNGRADVITAGFDGQGVQMYSASAGIMGRADRSLADETVNNNFKISFDMKANGGSHTYVLLYSKSDSTNYLFLNFDYAAGIYILNPVRTEWLYSYVNPGTVNPFKLTLEFDWDYGTYGGFRFSTEDLVTGVGSTPYYYGGTAFGLFTNYTGGAADANGTVSVRSNGNIMDNFSIVPEPAALSLLALGSLTMLRRKK